MSLSNYPPGVSGNEPEIAGYDEIEIECEECDADMTAYGSQRSDYYTYECGECGHFGEIAGYWQDRHDDQQFEAERERRLGL